MDMNKIFLWGNLIADPETRNTASGAQVTSFTIAVNDPYSKDKTAPPMFIKVQAWQKTAEVAAQYLRKGSGVLVDGRLKVEEYESRDGQKRRDPVVVAEKISLPPKPKESGQSSPPASQSQGFKESRSSAPRRENAPPLGDNDDPAPGAGDADSDLPF